MAKFIPYTFTKKDVIGNFINDKQYENWIAGQVRSKKVVKVRNGLYVQVDVSGYPLKGARSYRKEKDGMLRPNQWQDLTVRVFI